MRANTSFRRDVPCSRGRAQRRVCARALGCLIALAAGRADAENVAPRADGDNITPEADAGAPAAARCPPSTGRRVLAVGAAVVPGVLVHGAGHYVLCETETARRLVYIGAAGVGTTVVSGVGLALTGASRYVVAPLALGALGGLGAFGLTLLADIYGVSAPDGGTGVPAALPRLKIQTGLRSIHDRHFEARWLASHALRLDLGAVRLEPRLDAALDARVQRYALSSAWRVLGARPGEPNGGDRLEAGLALSDHAYSADGFATTTLDFFVGGRLDLGALGRTLRGSFVDGSAGYARQWIRFDGLPGDLADELLARFAFGIYLGARGGVSGESWLAYDHRRSTFAGGLLLPGIPAGYAGFVEQRTELFFGPRLGVATEVSYGSAFLASVYWLVRLDAEDR